MESKIDISVIIPMYNAEKYIKDAINSVLLQASHPFIVEIIIVDDKSVDDSCAIVKNMNHPQIILIELERNTGTANARNAGLRIAQGKWIQFLDSDDTICQDLYQKFAFAMKPGVNCYLFSIEHEYSDFSFRQIIIKIPDKRAFGHFGSVCNKFIKRKLCIAFKESYTFEDSIFIIDILVQKELHLGLIDNAYYKYFRDNTHSKMSNFNNAEFYKAYQYIFSQIDKCDDMTKMFILEIFLATAIRKEIHIFVRIRIVSTILAKLYKYLPSVVMDQNRTKVKNMMY